MQDRNNQTQKTEHVPQLVKDVRTGKTWDLDSIFVMLEEFGQDGLIDMLIRASDNICTNMNLEDCDKHMIMDTTFPLIAIRKALKDVRFIR